MIEGAEGPSKEELGKQDPGNQELSKIERLKLQYATIIDIGKFSYDAFFKLGAMSFTLNGFLIGGLSYFLSQAASQSNHVPAVIVAGVAVIGLVYNLGAGCAFISLSGLTSSIWTRRLELDRELGLEIAVRRTPRSNRWGTYTVRLTVFFFGLWILFWVGVGVWAFILYRSGATPSISIGLIYPMPEWRLVRL